ncbi:MAG: hypothetical protein ACR2FY_25905 [Pirellulaceae bacterium]
MRLLFPLFLAVALGTCLVTSLRAQELEVKQPQPAVLGVINDVDVTVTDLTEEKLNNPPKREIKIERLMEPRKRKLTKPDPKLFEQKFCAVFGLEIRTFRGSHRYLQEDGNLRQLPYLGENFLFAPQNTDGRDDLSESLLRMTKALPNADSITKEERAFLTDAESIGGLVSPGYTHTSPDPSHKGGWGFIVLGTTPEQAEMRSKALLTLLDLGVCRPVQLAIFKKREPLCLQLRDYRRTLAQHQVATNAAEEQLKSFAEFTPEMLPNLRVQQLQLDVDLAGVKARIATCEKLLAQPALKPERRSQIEDVKVTAEIESSGFEARRAKSEEFIGKVKALIDLRSKLSKLEFNRSVKLNEIRACESQIHRIDEAIRAYVPLPLVDNKITVQPLEWTQ